MNCKFIAIFNKLKFHHYIKGLNTFTDTIISENIAFIQYFYYNYFKV